MRMGLMDLDGASQSWEEVLGGAVVARDKAIWILLLIIQSSSTVRVSMLLSPDTPL